MSIDKNYYTIAGFDLTKYRTDKYEDWRWTEDGERFSCYQRKGKVQLFDDPMSGDYLYLGYIFGNGDQYGFNTTKFVAADIITVYPEVCDVLKYLKSVGVVAEVPEDITYGVIVFEECT